MENKKDNLLPLKSILKNISIEKWLLIAGAGIILILCSDGFGAKETEEKKTATEVDKDIGLDVNNSEEYAEALENKLEKLIENIDGAGDAQVMITIKSTSIKEVLTEDSVSEKELNEADSSGGSRESYEVSKDERVVLNEEGNSVKSPFVVSETNPKVEGVAVIVQGGDSPIVKEKITGIIKALFGIEINKIAVGKMK